VRRGAALASPRDERARSAGPESPEESQRVLAPLPTCRVQGTGGQGGFRLSFLKKQPRCWHNQGIMQGKGAGWSQKCFAGRNHGWDATGLIAAAHQLLIPLPR